MLLVGTRAHAAGDAETGSVHPAGIIEYIEGEVLLNGEEAQLGAEVTLGATVQTGTDSFCEVVFGGQNIFQIREESLAVISIDESHGQIDLKKGAVAAVFQRLQKLGTGGTFKLTTPTAVAGVRGTAFFVKVEDENNTYICTCRGRTELEDVRQGNGMQVSSSYHKAFRFTRRGGRINTDTADLLYHDNRTMDRLAGKIQSSIDWGGKAGYALFQAPVQD